MLLTAPFFFYQIQMHPVLHLLKLLFTFRIQEDKQEWVVRAKDPSKKLIELGVRFIPSDKIIMDTMDCFRSKGLI